MKRLLYIFAFLFLSLTAMAATITGGTVLYLKPNSNWTQANARFAAYFFGNGETWVSMTDSDGDGIYSCKKPTDKVYPNVIFCRMNPSASANNWNNKYNQTGDLTIPTDGNNLYTVKEGTWDKGGGTWSKLSYFEEDVTIYLKLNVNWKSEGARFAIYVFNANKNGWANMNKVDGYDDFYEVKIPSGDWKNVIFCRMNPSKLENNFNADVTWNQTSDLTYDGVNNCYIVEEGAWSKGNGKWVIFPTSFIPQNTPFYLKPNDNWKEAGARFAVNFFSVFGDEWVDVVDKDGDGIYSGTTPEGYYTNLIFCRMYPDKADNNWDNRWNQTADLTFSSSTPLCTLTGSVDNGTCKWENAPSITYLEDEKDLYLKPNSNWKSEGARFAAYFFSDLDEGWVSMILENNLYKVNIPSGNFTKLIFCRMKPSTTNVWENKWDQTLDLKYDGSDKNIYVIADGEWDKGAGYWMSFGGEVGTLPSCNKYVRSSFNEWGTTDKMTFDVSLGENGRFACTKILQSDNYEFKIAEEDWANTINTTCNQGECDITLSTQAEENPNVLFKLDAKSSVTFSIAGGKIYLDYTDVLFDDNTKFENAKYGKFTYQKTISGEDVKKWHWISLPYDVNVEDIKSNITAENPYDTDFIMKRYDTANRAAWTGKKPPVNDNTWVQLKITDVLEAGRGYILGVNNSLNSVTLTFPAADDFHVVNDVVTDNNTALSANHPENANWYLIGTGLYGETRTRGGAKPVNYVAYPTESGSDYTYHCFVENDWANLDPAFQEQLGTGVGKLEKYKAFFVQHSGEYSFSKAVEQQNMAPRRARAEEVVEQYYINIVGEKDTARTAIFLADDGADEYVVGKDFLHFGVTGQTAQLYTKQASSLLAFNHLKRENRIVDLGGYMVNAGEYTISMMDNGEALVVLIDNYTGESVDLTADSYTFTTEKGSLDGRFSLVISYVEKDVTTEIGNEMAGDLVVSNNGGLVVVDGLSVGSVVWIYDAVGHCVNRFVADSEQQELNICAGVYVLKTSTESVKFVVW